MKSVCRNIYNVDWICRCCQDEKRCACCGTIVCDCEECLQFCRRKKNKTQDNRETVPC
jgi:hypothetical protein